LKVLNAAQLKAWDQYTIQNEPVAPIDLMERAAQQCVTWLQQHVSASAPFYIFCGKGNNGGDGLAIARLLAGNGIPSEVYILELGRIGTPEFQKNLEELRSLPVPLHYIQSGDQFPALTAAAVVIDALYGFGLDRPLEGLSAALVNHLNGAKATIIAIDLPSGLFPDKTSLGNTIVKAAHTLTFECYKPALVVAENAPYIGDVHLLPINLHPAFLENLETGFEWIDAAFIKKIYRHRNRFAHKGTFGHALVMGGSFGKIGAVVLATMACLRSGAGLVTAYVPHCGYVILQMAAPEAMVLADSNEHFLTQPPPHLERFTALGIGPGAGTEEETGRMLQFVVRACKKPMVLDADALNLLAQQPQLLTQLFKNTILTPHPKEFERLFGTCHNDFERMDMARQKAAELNLIIILKGHHTLIALPDGTACFNSTGNAGMAKGGSGDILTGIITALLAQGYSAADASLLGVYLHGIAGDAAALALSQEAMTAGDLVAHLSKAFQIVNQY
jgi:NAD(P)H-hydrate epimerase